MPLIFGRMGRRASAPAAATSSPTKPAKAKLFVRKRLSAATPAPQAHLAAIEMTPRKDSELNRSILLEGLGTKGDCVESFMCSALGNLGDSFLGAVAEVRGETGLLESDEADLQTRLARALDISFASGEFAMALEEIRVQDIFATNDLKVDPTSAHSPLKTHCLQDVATPLRNISKHVASDTDVRKLCMRGIATPCRNWAKSPTPQRSALSKSCERLEFLEDLNALEARMPAVATIRRVSFSFQDDGEEDQGGSPRQEKEGRKESRGEAEERIAAQLAAEESREDARNSDDEEACDKELEEDDSAKEDQVDDERGPLPPDFQTWDWPLSRNEKKIRLLLLERLDRRSLELEVSGLRSQCRRLSQTRRRLSV